jgi:hypothetical protein
MMSAMAILRQLTIPIFLTPRQTNVCTRDEIVLTDIRVCFTTLNRDIRPIEGRRILRIDSPLTAIQHLAPSPSGR